MHCKADSSDDDPQTDSSGEDATYMWAGSVLVRCRGWGKHGCADGALIKHGRRRCSVCTNYNAYAAHEEKAAVAAVWDVWKRFGGDYEPDPEDTLADEPEPQDDNVMFQEGGESFTSTEAVVAAMEVARVLALNGERGFEELNENKVCKYGPDSNIFVETHCRLSEVADLPLKTRKAASVLGGVTAWPPIIPGKAGRSKIGRVDDEVEASFLIRLFGQTNYMINDEAPTGSQAEKKISLLFDLEHHEVKTVCNAALAAACVAHIKEKKLCSVDPGSSTGSSGPACRITWHHFRGGCWATGNFPTWQ